MSCIFRVCVKITMMKTNLEIPSDTDCIVRGLCRDVVHAIIQSAKAAGSNGVRARGRNGGIGSGRDEVRLDLRLVQDWALHERVLVEPTESWGDERK